MQGSFAVNNTGIQNEKLTGGIYAIDVRAKLIITIITSISAIALSSIYAQLVLFIASFFYAASMKKAKIMALTYLFVVLMICIAMIFLLSINYFFNFMEGRSYFAVMVPFMRMVTMINVVLPLAFTINIQSLLTALKSFRLPLFIYIPVAVMVRFIPAFVNDIKQIKESLTTRGINVSIMESIKHPVLTGRYLFMPVLFRSLRASEELGIAAELKGLGLDNKVVPYKKLTFTIYDFILIGLFFMVIMTAVYVQNTIEVPSSLRSIHK